MKLCPQCNKQIKNKTVVDGKVVNTQRRKYCYDCSPFGTGNNKKLKKVEVISKPSQKKDKYAEYQKQLRRERKHLLIEMFGGGCYKCGYNRCERALEFHHKNRKEKKFNLSALGYTCRWDKLVEEAKKCNLLCANCHREEEEEFDSAVLV